jgi:hypothetical protein
MPGWGNPESGLQIAAAESGALRRYQACGAVINDRALRAEVPIMAEPLRSESPDDNHIPYLRVVPGLNASPDQGRRSPHPPASPQGPRPEQELAKPGSRPGFAGVSWPLWAILGVSILFLAAVRIHVSRVESRWDAPIRAEADLPALLIHSPSGPASASALRLGWDPFPAAYEYRLKVTTDTGEIVFEGLPVAETAWSPSDEALPALTPGDYLWQVEAVDPRGGVLARSSLAPLRIAN